MATVTELFGTSNQAFTITMATLANATGSYGAGRASTAIDNTTNLYLDALVVVKITTSASALANDKCCYVYAYGTVDGGTTYSDGITGTDAAFTATNPPNVRLLGVINAVVSATAYVGGPWSVASAFGGVLPQKFGIFVVNFTGQAFTAGTAQYQGVTASVV